MLLYRGNRKQDQTKSYDMTSTTVDIKENNDLNRINQGSCHTRSQVIYIGGTLLHFISGGSHNTSCRGGSRDSSCDTWMRALRRDGARSRVSYLLRVGVLSSPPTTSLLKPGSTTSSSICVVLTVCIF